MHGHEFDNIVLNSKWIAKIGAKLYDYSVWFNNILNFEYLRGFFLEKIQLNL